MTTQPEALRLADVLGRGRYYERRAAAELRRLHAVNQELLGACETLAGLPNTEDWIATLRLAVDQARAAIARAEGQA